MDQQPRYNRILGYQPESNRATFDLAPDQYGSVAVINCARGSWQNPAMPEFTKVQHSQWQSGRSIRMNRLGDQGPPLTGDNVFPDTPPENEWIKYSPRGVYHRNCMWFDVEIDKQYLDNIAATHLDIIIRGNIADNMIYSTIWWPVGGSSGPGKWGPNTIFSTVEPENPLNPDNGGPTIWIQTIEENPEDPLDQPNQLNVPIAIWSYSKIDTFTTDLDGNITVVSWEWELIYGTSDSQGLYNTTTINNIPTYVFNAEKQCRFVVQVHWNQNFAHTAIDREVAMYVFKGDTDATRALDDYIVKSPIVRMRNQTNPGPPAPGEPYMKGFVPAVDLPYYSAPGSKNLSLPITNTEIVMDILSGTAMLDPNDEYEDAVFIDVIGEDATLTLYYGAGTEAWIMAPTESGNFPYYIGDKTQLPNSTEIIWIPTEEAGFLQLTGAGRYAIYGASALLPQTPEIHQWCDDNNFPLPDYQPAGIITQHPTVGMLENTQGLTNITSWADIMLASGMRMFRNVTGDFNLPEYQTLSDLTETFANTPDFTDSAGALNTWIVNSVTQAEGTFDSATVFNSDISAWYMGNVTTMRRMFKNATQFNQDIGDWDVSNVVYNGMIDMFMGASIFDQFLASWDVSNIPNKPPGFDTGTTSDWEEFEKPWWGSSNRPITSEYVMFDTIKAGLTIMPLGPDSNLQVFDVNNIKYKATLSSGQVYTCGIGRFALFGYANSIRLYNKNIVDNFNKDVITHYSEFNYIHTGYSNDGDFDGQELSSISHITSDNVISDIQRHITFTGDAETMRALSLDNVFGSANRFGGWHDIFGGIANNGFWALGRLPDGLPEDLKFGWSGNTDPENYLNRAFSQTSNLPDPSQWEFMHTDQVPDLTRIMAYNNMTEDLYKVLNTIMSKHAVASHEEIFWGSDLSLEEGEIDSTNTTHKITNLKGAYSHAILDNTSNQTQLTDCDLSMCASYDEVFLNAKSDTTHFVQDLRLVFSTDTTLRYAFAKSTCVPRDCSTELTAWGPSGTWDMTKTTDISGMFFDSVFPVTMDNWDLSNLDTEITYDRGHTNMPCQSHTYVFTGCSGTPSRMISWRLPPPKGMISETTFNPNAYGIDLKYGEWYVLDSRYTDTVVYHDVLLPWWFAGCSDFNTDISDWQTTPVTHDEPIQSVRLGTFAYATNFNSQIDWYYPDQDFYDLEFVRKNTHRYEINLYSYQFLKTRLKIHLNPETQKLDSVEYGKGAHKHTWWHTFLGAEAYNNGGQDLPIMCANDMVDTFRLSGIDSNITIRKPVWGHGYYQGVFRDTQAWTGTKVIDFECQNRSETPDLTNIYYHSIFANRMFRDSNFGGTLGSGFKWFWFNVTNIAGTLKMKTGIDREYSGWNNLSQRNSTDATDISTTQLGTLRAPVGNVTDTDSDIEQDTDADISQGEKGVACLNNSALYDTTRPPSLHRRMYQYCIGRPWRKMDVSSQTDLYNSIHTQSPRSLVEVDNLSEMFMNATEFTQDLSAMWTRWTPPSGAFTDTQDRPWDNSVAANEWFGINLPSTVRSYNSRNQQRGEVSNNVYPVYGIGEIQDVLSDLFSEQPGLRLCDYKPATKYHPYIVDVYTDWTLYNCDTQPTQTERFELVPGIKFGCRPENETIEDPDYEPDYDGPYKDLIVPGETYNFTATVGPEPSSRASANYPKLGYAVYRSLTTNKILVFQAFTQTVSGLPSTAQTFQTFPEWMVLDNITVPYTSWQEGTVFTATVDHKIRAYGYPWILVKEDQPITENSMPEQEFEEILLENSHRYNNYNGYESPNKSDCDLIYIDQYAKLDQFDYASKSSREYHPYEDGIPDELWHGVMTQPKNFATGATNFTSDKWPVWMTGLRDTPMSTTEIQEFLDPSTVRPVGATKYITSNPWGSEPYDWPTASWYQDGTY